MSTSTPDLAAPTITGGEAFWFLGALLVMRATAATTGGRLAVIEHLAPRGHGSPLHVHHREDEWFYVTEGELTIWVDGETTVAGPGTLAFAPRDVPHTFSVSSDQARFLLGVQPAGFEEFVRALGEPAGALELPPPATEPPDVAGMTQVAARFGIDITGPPGIPG